MLHFLSTGILDCGILQVVAFLWLSGTCQAVSSQMCTDSWSRAGSCLPLSLCPQLIQEYYGQAASSIVAIDFQTFIGSSFCGFDGVHFMICCASDHWTMGNRRRKEFLNTAPASSQGASFQFASLGASTLRSPTMSSSKSPVFQPTPPSTGLPTVYQPVPNVPTMPNVPLSTSNCGISSATTSRVVGGLEARRGAYPWIAALGYYDEQDHTSLRFLCAGSLIHSSYVITSAHCINTLLTLVRLGAHDLSKPSEPDAVDLRIKRTVVHENFNLASIANDIALVELITAVPFTAKILPICLPAAASTWSNYLVGMNPFVAGWGATKHQAPTSNVLRDVQVPVVDRQTCEQSYKSVFRFVEFSDKLICAGNSNVDACQGDSGGALMMPQLDGSTYRFFLEGIVSFGYECARQGFPGVYTRVASYIPWIKQNIQ